LSSPESQPREWLRRQYSFDEFTLDVEHRVLRRAGEEITLRPKSFDVLVCLVDHHGQVVTKAALMEEVWPGTTVTENSLAQCLMEIRRAIGDHSQQLIRTVARRGYLFAGQVAAPLGDFPRPQAVTPAERQSTLFPPSPLSHRGPRMTVAVALLAAAGVAALLVFFVWRVSRAPESQGFRALPLNSLPGEQRYPSFSPDGNHVAFMWTGPAQDNKDVYVQHIGTGSRLRLTTDPRIDYNPVWSPDGRWIAFLRRRWEAGTSELRLIPLGGPERELTEIRVNDTYFIMPPYLAWCPDSNCLLVTDSPGEDKPSALFVVSLESGAKRPLTYPQFPAIGDTNPAVSLDGSWLVFRRQTNLRGGELYRLPLGTGPARRVPADSAGLTAAGEPQRLTSAALDASYPTWIPGSKEILFSARGNLWRMVVPGRNTPARLPFAGEDGIMPVVSPTQSGRALRLAYIRSFQDTNIWRVDLPGPGTPASAPPVVSISSTRMDSTPQLSPDGRRVLFTSDRSGAWEIWLADPDGSNIVQLTSMGAVSAAPCWSPDGEQIVFQYGRFRQRAVRPSR
jgi:Tol biopolymer transport system component/DNA-binding winged helix-turn-helix (wHTH) protein